MTTDPSTGASELALALAELAVKLPEPERRKLARLLAHTIAAPPPARLREDVLGLLAELTRHGEVITVERYSNERLARLAQGQSWPTATTLMRRYGPDNGRHGDAWRAAIHAAMRLNALGGLARVHPSHRRARTGQRYTRDGVIAAIRQCYWQHHQWPSQWEYEEWARVMHLQHVNGTSLPAAETIRKLYGSWTHALTAAQTKHVNDMQQARCTPMSPDESGAVEAGSGRGHPVRPLQLTPAGRTFLAQAREALRKWDELERHGAGAAP